MRSSTHRIDVGNGLSTVVTVHHPDDPPERPVVAVCFPGGGYSRGYFDIRHGDRTYSQAEYHTSRGWYVVACDHLGVGDSDLPEDATLSLESAAEADAKTAASVVELLDLCPSTVVGIGQSMGGCLLIVAQARHQPFDGIAVLGFSAAATTFPVPDGDALFVDPIRWAFHSDDADPALVDADFGTGFPIRWRVPQWGSATMPSLAMQLLTPGIVADYARDIDVPVFIGCGDRDIVADPRREPGSYAACRDLTVVVVPAMAHMHNFARSRETLWSRLQSWGDGLRSSRLRQR